MTQRASQPGVAANFYWIWFVGAAAWFLDAALDMHHHALVPGLLAAAVSALFLAAGMFFRAQAHRAARRRDDARLQR